MITTVLRKIGDEPKHAQRTINPAIAAPDPPAISIAITDVPGAMDGEPRITAKSKATAAVKTRMSRIVARRSYDQTRSSDR